jgi:hypothetical protein
MSSATLFLELAPQPLMGHGNYAVGKPKVRVIIPLMRSSPH